MPVERGRVRGVRGAGGPGGARRRGGPDLARWDSDRDGGDRDRVSMKFKNIHDSSKSAHEIQSRNEIYNLKTIDLS